MVRNIIHDLDPYIFDVQTRFQTERLKTILRDKKRRQSELYICGDLNRFIESLTAAERHELIDGNPDLHLTPPLSPQEREVFQRASQPVRDVFIRIGGLHSREVLDRLLTATSHAAEVSDQ